MDERILGTEKVSKLFLQYTIPAVISMVLAGSQTLIGGMLLGNYVGANALAAVNIVNPFVQFAMAVSMVIAFGSLSIIGRNLGAGNKEMAQNTFRTAMVLIAFFAILYGVFGFVSTAVLAKWLGADATLMADVISYLKTYSIFLVFYPLMILTGFADRIVGKPKLYLHATIMTLFINTSLGYVFIKHFGWGVKGAALATGLAYLMGFLVTVKPMLNKKHTINVFVGHFDRSTIFSMMYNGASEGIGSASTALAIYLFNLEFMRRIGPSGVAAFTTIGFVVQFGTLVIFGIADGISPIVSYNFGHNKFDRVKTVIKDATLSGFVIGCLLFIILLIGGERLAGMFANGNAEVIEIAAKGSRIYAFAFLVNSFNIIYSVYFTAIGGAKESAIIAFSRGIIWIVLGINLWPMVFGMTGVWMTIPVAETMTLLLVMYLAKANALDNEGNSKKVLGY